MDGLASEGLDYPRGLAPDLAAVAQEVIGEHAGHHRLANRNRANADAGIVTALGHDLGFVADAIDSAPRGEDRGRGLDRKARDDWLAGRDAAQDAAGMIGQKAGTV